MSPKIVIIPARYESSRFPGKPLALICDKPMIEHVYSRAKRLNEIDEVYVATDDERIMKCVESFGGKAIMTKKEHPSGTDRIAEAIDILNISEDSIIINIQGDQPTFSKKAIIDLLRPFNTLPYPDMSTLVYRIRRNEEIRDPNHVKTVWDKKGRAIYFSRSPIPYFADKSIPPIYYKHLGFYAYTYTFLKIFVNLPPSPLEKVERLEQLRALEHGYEIRVVETSEDSIEIDRPEDISRVEAFLRASNTF